MNESENNVPVLLGPSRCRSKWNDVFRWVTVTFAFCVVNLVSYASHAESPYQAETTRISASGGAGAGGFAIGFDVGYFAADGLELSGGATYLNRNGLNVLQITPGVRYILDLVTVDPYVGGFMRHWWFLGSEDESPWSIGVRGGLILRSGQLFLGIGVAREVVLDCPRKIDECTRVYPEITFAVHL